jgi:hypothetical protein
MVTVHAAVATNNAAMQQIRHLAHIVLRVQSVRDDAELVKLSTEPHSCCGLMTVDKVSVPGHVRLPVTEPMLLMVRLQSCSADPPFFFAGQCLGQDLLVTKKREHLLGLAT